MSSYVHSLYTLDKSHFLALQFNVSPWQIHTYIHTRVCVYFYATTTSKLLSSQLTQFSSCLPSHSVGSHRLRPWFPWLSPLQKSIKSPRCFICASEWLPINWVPITLCSGSFSLLGQLSELRKTPVYFKGMRRTYRWRMSSVWGKGPSWNHSLGTFTDYNCSELPKTWNHILVGLGEGSLVVSLTFSPFLSWVVGGTRQKVQSLNSSLNFIVAIPHP